MVFYRKTSGNDRCTDVSGQEDVRDPRDLPLLATLPATFNDVKDDITTDTDFSNNQLILGKLTDNANLDLDGEERYYYEVTDSGSLNVTNGESLLADGEVKVVIIVSGDLDISGTGGNVFIGNTSDDPFNIDPYYAPSNFLEIHVTGDVNIGGTGTFYINGLIRANGTVNITGSPTINLRGSIWANNWDNGGGIVNIIRDAGYDDYKYYSITPQRTPNPLTYAPTGWQTQEAD